MASRAEVGDALREALESIGANVGRWRSARALTQEQLAELAAMDVRFLQRLERGERSPSITNLVTLALALGVRPAALLRPARLPAAKRGRPPRRRR